MEIAKKIARRAQNMRGEPPVTIATLGDSNTQGCFEIYKTGERSLETVFESKYAYGTRLSELLHVLYPGVAINLISAGISGDNAPGGLARLERDVLHYHPDLTIVSFGTNDCTGGLENISVYTDALRQIFKRLQEEGSEIIFLTQNYMNTKISPHVTDPFLLELAETFAKLQNEGVLKAYYDAAKRVCQECDVKVCDLYSAWEAMDAVGVDTTALLSNHLNHPIREYPYYTAIKLAEIILDIKI